MSHTIIRSRWRVTLELPSGERLTELVLAESSGEAMRKAETEYRMRTGTIARAVSCTVEGIGR
jgi:hypothetical protein